MHYIDSSKDSLCIPAALQTTTCRKMPAEVCELLDRWIKRFAFLPKNRVEPKYINIIDVKD